MKIINIDKEQLIKFLFDESLFVSMGSNGIISVYDDQTLVKIHYKDIIESYHSRDFTNIEQEIDEKLTLEKKMKSLGIDKTTILKQLIN